MNAEESFFDKKLLKAIAGIVCLAVLVIFAGYHIYRVFTTEVQYVPAKERVTVDSITFAGYVAREETVITDAAGGIISSPYANASKHTKDEICVYVYPESCAELIARISRLEDKLALLSRVMSYSSLSAAENNISLSYVELMKVYAAGSSDAQAEVSALLEAMMTRDYIFDKNAVESIYEGAKTELASAKAELSAVHSVKGGQMPYTGYMFKNGDRYGSVFSKELAVSGSADDILNAISLYNSESYIDSSERVAVATRTNVWYILAPISDAEADLIERGSEYRVNADGVSLKCVVEDIRRSKNAGGTVAVLKTDDLPPSFDYNRKMTVTLYFEEQRTYNLPVSAVRTADSGETGVYIMSGGVVLFRRVEVVKSTDTYVLVKSHASYVDGLNEEKPAEEIYGMESGDSSDIGIFRGNAYTEFKESISDNYTVLIKGPFGDMRINTRTENEPSEFSYLEENELIIISGRNLYHGKLLS